MEYIATLVTHEQGTVCITYPRAYARQLDTLTNVLFEQGVTLGTGMPLFLGGNVEVALALNPRDPRSLDVILRDITDIATMMLTPAN